MSVPAHGNATSLAVEEDILVPLLAPLPTSAPCSNRTHRLLVPVPLTAKDRRRRRLRRSAAEDAKLRARCRALLEKVRQDMVQLERVFRRIDDVEKRIRYSFDPVEQHLDDALQHEQPADAAQIHARLLVVDAGIGSIKAAIRESYNIRSECGDDDGGWAGGEGEPSTASPSRSQVSCATMVMTTNRMGEIRHGPQMSHLRLAVGSFEARLRGCVLCLAAFPEGAVIKKRMLLHWWVAEGFVRSADEGKSRFDELIAQLWRRRFAHRACLRGGKAQQQEAAGFRAVVRAIYIQHRAEVRRALVRRQEGPARAEARAAPPSRSPAGSPMDSHIEVSDVERFRDMESCRNLTYVSFWGISRIEFLPSSIGKLRQLQVLDLRACHNLEELGEFEGTRCSITDPTPTTSTGLGNPSQERPCCQPYPKDEMGKPP
ncbi:LOW QUALITY PROTEIN: hypothetical protein SORBI_3010G170500 [Sorghum bicolor]|uniref:Rx N-terminal domain-containing protein n=1 Tax=Sorghum bicolor TaxID=4558 RepID=A0A1W0VTH5_SORBI|nr:LOW QUALITY PROTEIN: hypothetical protein SORBI_3010G170500 [Sorghum bicolor]